MEEGAFFTSLVLKLLLFSAVTAVVVLILWKVGKFLLAVAGKTSNNNDSNEDMGCGCLIAIICAILWGVFSYIGSKYDAIIQEYLSDSNPHEIQADHDSGPITVIKKSHGLLYNHYSELKAVIYKDSNTCNKLEQEMRAVSGERARRTFAERIIELKKNIEINQKMVNEIEETAGKLYFAQMMDSLGLRVNQDELNAELGIMQKNVEKKD